MPIPLAVSAGISLLPALYKGISGIFQKNKANSINPVDPGYTMNSGVLANAESLRNRASNYIMPGYSKALGNINSTYSTAFNNGVQGASSGEDVLDLATKIAYGQANASNNLAAQNAQGAEGAYLQSLQGNMAEGQEYQNKNAYDREKYMMELREKAGLTQAANENIYGALDSAAGVATNMFTQPSATTTTSVYGNPLGSIFDKEEYTKKLLSQYNMGSTR